MRPLLNPDGWQQASQSVIMHADAHCSTVCLYTVPAFDPSYVPANGIRRGFLCNCMAGLEETCTHIAALLL